MKRVTTKKTQNKKGFLKLKKQGRKTRAGKWYKGYQSKKSDICLHSGSERETKTQRRKSSLFQENLSQAGDINFELRGPVGGQQISVKHKDEKSSVSGNTKPHRIYHHVIPSISNTDARAQLRSLTKL